MWIDTKLWEKVVRKPKADPYAGLPEEWVKSVDYDAWKSRVIESWGASEAVIELILEQTGLPFSSLSRSIENKLKAGKFIDNILVEYYFDIEQRYQIIKLREKRENAS